MIDMSELYYARFLQTRFPTASSQDADRAGKPKIMLILGARQTGKSTLLDHQMGRGKRIFSVNLQDRRLRRRYEADDGLLLRELEASSNIESIFIDEIQKVPALLDDVQLLYDQDPRRFRFFLTGSSARKLKRRSSNLLPGRIHTLLLSPVLQAEQRKSRILPITMERGEKFPIRMLEDYLVFGNLPGLYQENTTSWVETLSAYVELYIENEIRQEHIVEDMGAFVRFLRLAALESGQCVNYTKLARAVGVASNTLRNFYQVLEDTYVGIRIPPFGRSRKRILQAPRFIIFDLGVRHILAELPLNDSLLKLDAGHIFEQWVLTELFYRCRCHGKEYKLSTWQTSTGAEVDGVVETPEEVIPVEVKWTGSPSPRDARHVETFIDLHREFCSRGFVVCRCPREQQLTDRVTAIPWSEF